MSVLAAGVSAAVLAMHSPAQATTTITVGVAANFSGPLSSIITAFHNYYYPSYDFAVNTISKSTGALESDIISGGTTGPYDLFLAADKSHVDDLVTTHSSLVYPYTTSPSSLYEFHYASGALELYSDNTNVSSGLPNPFNTDFVIADPTNAPYGHAAQQLLAGSPWYYTSAIPGGYVHTASNIDNTYAAIQAHTYAYGFVAKSQICSFDGTTYTFTGNSHHSYTTGYDPISQYGVEIAISSRTPDQQDELDKLVDFILNNSTAQSIIRSYCYTYP
ncbi:substrate-binding domain-containing protein [Methylosinus sp. PW1]|uniref:molybdate ABC transporter substrate-binding protein n=1 Tax=Methylosinus sp. PW1 TaxID=107636 RepID=UPI0018DCAF49|nr:substrate-binding domain-containing protein [Methylosinus sp. PW1]